MKEESRALIRKPVRGQALLVLPEGVRLRGRTKDLSQAGICVHMPEPVAVGLHCTVALRTTHNGDVVQFMATGKVTYSILSGTEGFQIGVHFLEIDAANSKVLATLIG